MKLYEMTESAAQLYDLLQSDEIDEQTFNDTLEAMGANEKVEGYCQIITEMNGDLAKIKAETDRLAVKKKTLTNRIAWLKEQLLQFYLAGGKKKINAGTFTVSGRKSESVHIVSEADIPEDYLIVRATPDKATIKNALKAGENVPGAELIQKESVQIR